MRNALCLLCLLALLAVPARAEGARCCTIRCERTDELFHAVSPLEFAAMRQRFGVIYSTSEPDAFRCDVEYCFVENVTAEWNGQTLPLQDALQEGKLTVEQIYADVCRDARAGLCSQSALSQNGVTRFLFAYPDMTLVFVNDILEAPSGECFPIRSLCVKAPGLEENGAYHYYDPNSRFFYDLDREDWGLDMEVIHAEARSAAVTLRQSGGQQFGQLILRDHSLFASDFSPLSARTALDLPLNMGGTTPLTIDFPEALSPGEYVLRFHIEDIYDPETLHPLTRNYYDEQNYFLEFSVGD